MEFAELSTTSNEAIRVLCLDDETNVIRSLNRLFRQNGIHAELCSDPQQALALIRDSSFEVVISDMRMPEMDGATFLHEVKRICPDTQRILLTGYSDLASTIKAINESGIHAYIQKPWDNDILVHTVRECSEKYRLKSTNKRLNEEIVQKNAQLTELNENLEGLVQKRTAQIRKVLSQLEQANQKERKEHRATVELLYNFLNANPFIDGKKAKSIAKLCKIIAKKLELSSEVAETAMMSGYLAEVGLLAMDPEIYKSPPRKLSEAQKKIYYTHPSIAQLMLMPAQHLSDVSEAIYHQFEKFNGQGIPKGLKGKEIPLGSQILAVARDYYDNLYSANGSDKEKADLALDLIRTYRGNFYSPEVVDILETAVSNNELGQEQVGSVDILTTEKLKPGMILGLALHSNQGILLLPKGHIFTDKSIDKLKQLETQRPIPFRIMVKR
ncbi:HD domain-containing phosphohydrolase [Pseudoalteromonas sp. M8]|uniref:HD domain-containing phosphohydrolase n=1 Tax=Pseudoalteromonas sp. M8 TaxID=2692624 RepID=UPI001BA6F6F6|nr:HD domain-containing phosphohydrolase [Pseudoalteromonas sp. M8]QUI68256.1 response regulator [Pseudoalteromonas sp. M8]